MPSEDAILKALGDIHKVIDEKSNKTHERIDSLVTVVGEVRVEMAKVNGTVKTTKRSLDMHLGDHKDIQKTWVGELIRGAVGLIVLFVGTYLIIRWGIK